MCNIKQISKPVFPSDREIEENIRVLKEYAKDSNMIALAANRIGIFKRIIYLKKEDKVLINPVIIDKEGLVYYDGIKTPYRINIEYYDKNAKYYTENIEGLNAAVLCYEINNLDNINKNDSTVKKYEIIRKNGEFKTKDKKDIKVNKLIRR